MTTETTREGTPHFYRGHASLFLASLRDGMPAESVEALAGILAAAFERGHALGAASRASPEADMEQGGEWLGAARRWIKRRGGNGERVTWGSDEPLVPAVSVADAEDLARDVMRATVQMAASRASPEEGRAPGIRLALAICDEEAAAYEANARACDAAGNHFGGAVDLGGAEACKRIGVRLSAALRSPPAPSEETRAVHLFVSPLLTSLCGLDLTKHDGRPGSFAKDGEPTGPAATSNPQLADCVPCLRFHARALEAKADTFVDLAATLAGKAAPPPEDSGEREAGDPTLYRAPPARYVPTVPTLPHDDQRCFHGIYQPECSDCERQLVARLRAPASSKEGGR